MRLVQATPLGVLECARVLLEGGLAAYPTDTVYGLGCDPFNQWAVLRLVTAKERRRGGLPVLVDTLERAKEFGRLSEMAMALAKRFWPGPLTLVVPARVPFPSQVGPKGSVGLRIPNRKETVDLISQCHGAIVGTSANISGNPSSKTAEEVMKNIGDRVDIVLDGGPSTSSSESTVVKADNGTVTILREGAVPKEGIFTALGLGAERGPRSV